jgi:hypothetical protein
MRAAKKTRMWARWTLVVWLGLAVLGVVTTAMNRPAATTRVEVERNSAGDLAELIVSVGLFGLALTWALKGRATVREITVAKVSRERELLELQGANEPGERDRADSGYGR